MATHNTPSRRWMKLQTLGLIILLSNAPSPSFAKPQSFTLGDLPTCALMCATQAASAVNCTMNDIACLCSHPNFTTSTIQCADTNGQCPIEDRASVDGVLSAICLAGSTLSASSSSSSSSSSQGDPISTSKGLGPGPIKPLPSTTSNSPPSSSPTSSSPSPSPSEPSATPSSTDDVSSLISSSQSSATSTPTTATVPASQSASSTTVVVQTIMVPPTSLASSAVREQREVWTMMFLGLVGTCLCAGI